MNAVKSLFAPDKSLIKAQKQAAAAQAESQAQIGEERRKTEAVAAGQQKLRTAGRGLLSFVDEKDLRLLMGG